MADNSRKSQLIALLEQALTDAKQLDREEDVMCLVRDGYALTIEMAADILDCSTERVRQICERTLDIGNPIGFKFKRDWNVVTNRLLDWVEEHSGKHARLIAEDRAKKYRH
jgi:hypothetical protein